MTLPTPLRVRLVTTWDIPCGVAEHSRYLVDAVTAADPAILFETETNLHPDALRRRDLPDLILLNYHAALHSQWTPQHVHDARRPVAIIYHDSGVPSTDQCKGLHAVADLFVVHEPVEDLPGAQYLRQGIPAAPLCSYIWGTPSEEGPRQYYDQPLLGTVGFPFPWKNYDLLVDATAAAGWALLLLAPTATPEQIAAWTARHPALLVVPDFLPAETVVAYLAGCDATAFLYMTHNAGTSGAIRQGIAARKPVLATWDCRQFRDLQDTLLGVGAIYWLYDLSIEAVAQALSQVPIQRVDPGIVALAERDSWMRVGQRLAALLREVVR